MNQEDTSRQISRHAVINAARKAGVKSISKEAVNLTRDLLESKLEEFSNKLCTFYSSKVGRTVTRKMVLQFLESENILVTCGKDLN